jgi:hypothetical protein
MGILVVTDGINQMDLPLKYQAFLGLLEQRLELIVGEIGASDNKELYGLLRN